MCLRNFIKFFILSISLICIVGCQSMNSRFGKDKTNYADAKELPPLKFPPHSLSASNRYDIPAIPGNTEQVITEIVPPDF